MAGRKLGGQVPARELEVGEAATGVFFKQKSIELPDDNRPGQMRTQKMYHFRDEKQKAFMLWGCAMLDLAMEDAKPGMKLKVERLKDGAKKKKGRNAPKMFDVEVLEEAEGPQDEDAGRVDFPDGDPV